MAVVAYGRTMSSRPAAGGGRWVDVDPGRLGRWLDGFAERHGRPEVTADGAGLLLTAADGATAELSAPPGVPGCGDLAGFLDEVRAERRLGLLLVRKGAVAVGVAEGERLVSSKVDTRYVQGRTAAGGWSQQRFARRRDNQARQAFEAAADHAARILAAAGKVVLVTGGDHAAVDEVLADPRLGRLRVVDPWLAVPDPKRAVLDKAVTDAQAVRIEVENA